MINLGLVSRRQNFVFLEFAIAIAGCTAKGHRKQGINSLGLKMIEELFIQQEIRQIFITALPSLSRALVRLLSYEFTACKPHPIGSGVSRIN